MPSGTAGLIIEVDAINQKLTATSYSVRQLQRNPLPTPERLFLKPRHAVIETPRRLAPGRAAGSAPGQH